MFIRNDELTNLEAREKLGDCMVVVAFVEKDGIVLSEVMLLRWRIVIDTSVILKSITFVFMRRLERTGVAVRSTTS